MLARQYIELNPHLKDRVLEQLHNIGAYEELGFVYHDSEMWTNEDGMYCDIKEVEDAMLDNITLYESDIKEIE